MDHTGVIYTTIFLFLYSTFFLSFALPTESLVATATLRNDRTENDRLALLAIKENIVDSPSHVLNSWNSSSLIFCNWQGVTCSARRQRVIKLNLSSLGLVGPLSPYIGNLSFLRTLLLFNNSFQDKIPHAIGRLHRLQDLELYNNSFVGEIPVNISHCTNLQILALDHNQLVGKIPFEFGSLSKLVQLVLETNKLSGSIPPSIGNLSNLQALALNYNHLEGSIPNSIGQLKSLSYIGLGPNSLSGMVPPSLYNISSLISITLSKNQLTGNFPQKIGLPNLQTFLIGGNRFSGSIPVSLFNSSGLLTVEFSDNSFTGKVPPEVGKPKGLQKLSVGENQLGTGDGDDLDFLTNLTNCSDLYILSISSNHFGGVLPNSISNLSSQLTRLYIGKNQIRGNIPSGFQKYVNLILLSMSGNFLTGSIPFSIGMLKNLQVLALYQNRLSGQLPSSLGNLSSLYNLFLTDNLFEGSITPDIGKCTSLQALSLSNNNLQGTIPKEFSGLSSQLIYLFLSNNSLVGSLSFQLDQFIHLQVLNVSENNMSGEIPDTLGRCSSLEDLSLRGNLFSGSIPPSFKSLQELRSLDLSMNNLSGEIPEALGNLTMLRYLNLSFNNVEGGVPTEGIFKNASAFSIIGNYKLCGGISELHLRACPAQRSGKRMIFSTLKITLGIVIPSVVAFFIVAYLWLRTRPKEKPFSEPIMVSHFERVSYHELHQATEGFSSANLIGEGSFGSVYKGILHEDQGPVAIKVLNLSDQGSAKSFIKECDALRKIRHRNLLKILTICSSLDFQGNDFKALVLKFMANGSLENYLHPSSDGRYPTRALNLFERINIAIDIASALDYLHNHCETPIVHCDLKPSNILLDEDMTGHVGDFGLAKILHRSTSSFSRNEINTTSLKGTIGYIPPEYGVGTEVTKQGDVYSYGILLLEMFTGKRPTSDTFKDGLTLHDYSRMALPSQVMDIVDPLMLLWGENREVAQQREMDGRVQECIVSILKIGVACSEESQSKRIDINDALMELHVIKEQLT